MDTHRIFTLRSPEEFNDLALETFQIQYRAVSVYRDFCDLLKRTPGNVRRIEDIPFLPIELFKTHRIIRDGFRPQIVFRSSGTTGSTRSSHYVADTGIYRESFTRAFEYFYGSPSDYCILALLPSYRERPDASLAYMVSELIEQSRHPLSSFVTEDPSGLNVLLDQLHSAGDNLFLLGVSFALLDLALNHPRPLPGAVIMETGGMKGRRKEMIREELHLALCEGFKAPRIHSEYGMTELLSQAYSKGSGLFRCPPWMQVRMRDTEDPFTNLDHGRTGGINVIDLANQHSCAFLATQDLGRLYPDGCFEVLGRFDHSDVRGCNLMAL